MKLHISSFVRGMPAFTGVKPLRGYRDYIGSHKVEPIDLKNVQTLMCSFSLNYIDPEIAEELEGLDNGQLSLIVALFKYGYTKLTKGLVNAYALKLNVNLSSDVFNTIFSVLEKWGILFEQCNDGIIEYVLCTENVNLIYAKEG